MATTKGSLFDPTLVTDLMTKVRGKSSLAALCAQTPIPFNGLRNSCFPWINDIDIVARVARKQRVVSPWSRYPLCR